MKKSSNYFWSCAFACGILAFMAGCKEISTETIALLNITATTSKERAISFTTISSMIVEKESKDAEAVAAWKDSHKRGLDAQAAGLKMLSDAIAVSKKKFSPNTIDAIENELETSKSRANNFRLMSKYIKVKEGGDQDAFDRWKEAHLQALDGLNVQMEKFLNTLKKKNE